MVRPQFAIITTVEPVHLEFFAGIEAIADAKAEIFAGVEPGGAVVLNRDNAQFARLRAVPGSSAFAQSFRSAPTAIRGAAARAVAARHLLGSACQHSRP